MKPQVEFLQFTFTDGKFILNLLWDMSLQTLLDLFLDKFVYMTCNFLLDLDIGQNYSRPIA